jgi:hypothetical protein
MNMHNNDGHLHYDGSEGHHHHNKHFLQEEIMCHLPYAIFSVAFGLAILSFLAYSSCITAAHNSAVCLGSHILFHSFHFMHIVFAATGTVITFLRFSTNTFKAFCIGALSTMFFCTMSDAVLPYIGGLILGVNMHFHLCFLTELSNVVPFLIVGLCNGYLMSRHGSSRQSTYSIFSHFIHILISSFASIFYLVSNGFTEWYLSIGPVFAFLVFAVVVPCTMSDVVVPMMFAKADKSR